MWGPNGTFPGISAVETPSYLPAPLSAGFCRPYRTCPPSLPAQGLRLGLHFLAALRLLLIGATVPTSPTLLEYKAEAPAVAFVSVSGRSAQFGF